MLDSADADSLPPQRWLSDANILSLLSLINARQIAVAEIELENWHYPGIRDFALSMLRDHTSLQRSIDSASEHLRLAPIRPALADRVSAVFQAQVDSMLVRGRGGRGNLDIAFVGEQITSHQLMANYVQQFAAAAETVELQNFLNGVGTRVAAELSQSRAMQRRPATSYDSAAPDSMKGRDSASIQTRLDSARRKADSALAKPDSGRAKPDSVVKPDSTRAKPDTLRTKPDTI